MQSTSCFLHLLFIEDLMWQFNPIKKSAKKLSSAKWVNLLFAVVVFTLWWLSGWSISGLLQTWCWSLYNNQFFKRSVFGLLESWHGIFTLHHLKGLWSREQLETLGKARLSCDLHDGVHPPGTFRFSTSHVLANASMFGLSGVINPCIFRHVPMQTHREISPWSFGA